MNILTCALLKLDDSEEFQILSIVPKISKSNIDIVQHKSVVLKLKWFWLDGIEFFNRVELQICKYKIIHKNLVGGFSRFQRFVERAE
jgi:hypothetical protein